MGGRGDSGGRNESGRQGGSAGHGGPNGHGSQDRHAEPDGADAIYGEYGAAEAVSQGDYDLDVFSRGAVRESEDDGIGLRPEKHAAPMLRLFTKDQGRLWLCWGGITGGEQDPSGEKWFELYYHGMLKFDGGVKFGHFVIRVEGDGLEQLCHQMAKHVRTNLRIGRTANNDKPIVVSAISVKLLEFEDTE